MYLQGQSLVTGQEKGDPCQNLTCCKGSESEDDHKKIAVLKGLGTGSGSSDQDQCNCKAYGDETENRFIDNILFL